MFKYAEMLFRNITNCDALKAKSDEINQTYILDLTDTVFTSNRDQLKIDNDIIGQYSLSFGSHNPEGGVDLFLTEQNIYAIGSFGEIQMGKWKVVKERYLHLIPDKPERPFYVYGRYNPMIGDSTMIYFNGNDFSYRTFIHLGGMNDSIPILTPIFNEDRNCTTSPYVMKTNEKFNKLSFAYNNIDSNNGEQEIGIYSFENNNSFNEFIILEYTRIWDCQPIRAVVDRDKLMFGKDQITRRQPLPKNFKEELKSIENILNVKSFPKYKYFTSDNEEIHSNDVYPELYYSPGDAIGHYLSKEHYQHLTRYESLNCTSKHEKQFIIDEKPIIYSVCD